MGLVRAQAARKKDQGLMGLVAQNEVQVKLNVEETPINGTIHISSKQCRAGGTVCSVRWPDGFEAMCLYHKVEFNLETHCTVRRCRFPERQR